MGFGDDFPVSRPQRPVVAPQPPAVPPDNGGLGQLSPTEQAELAAFQASLLAKRKQAERLNGVINNLSQGEKQGLLDLLQAQKQQGLFFA